MDDATIQALCDLNSRFYREQSSSFSQTRQLPWKGWGKLLAFAKLSKGSQVLDLACGNMRFAAFLDSEMPDSFLSYYGVDNCDTLVPETMYHRVEGDGITHGEHAQISTFYQSLDVISLLLSGGEIAPQLEAPPCDLAVSFGFLHHVPTQAYRIKIVNALVEKAAPDGCVAFSLWQFMRDPAMAKKAQMHTEKAAAELGIGDRENNDYFLGWKDVPHAYRYCHSFSEEEIDELIMSLSGKAQLVDRYLADGRSGGLNTYVIMKRT